MMAFVPLHQPTITPNLRVDGLTTTPGDGRDAHASAAGGAD